MRTSLRLLGLLVLVDGVLSAVFGHAFIRRLRSLTPSQVHVVLEPFERIPEPLFRLGALLQAISGAGMIVRSGSESDVPGGR